MHQATLSAGHAVWISTWKLLYQPSAELFSRHAETHWQPSLFSLWTWLTGWGKGVSSCWRWWGCCSCIYPLPWSRPWRLWLRIHTSCCCTTLLHTWDRQIFHWFRSHIFYHSSIHPCRSPWHWRPTIHPDQRKGFINNLENDDTLIKWSGYKYIVLILKLISQIKIIHFWI